ncbi:uncharacterized protein LOC110879121 isoform X1 [Helianthus annuus]|uniref:uncharacterized protein LOC110879121 isoform X1 n=1 Tax=Helianthus annuus TaxID=4232 RepID=UPI0016530D6A|nr:uncharacterized protein LOC110879121 isoform X1 [Helianthus annuus]
MAKSKNHTAHNQSYKAHRNGIKKPRKHRHTSTKDWRQFGGGSGGCWWWLWKWTNPGNSTNPVWWWQWRFLLLHWKYFEAERTSVFDHLIQVISYAIEIITRRFSGSLSIV